MSANVQLGEFLRARRADISPESVGLVPHTDVLAANRLAPVLLTDFRAMPARERNLTREARP